jgi:hypothetical protein
MLTRATAAAIKNVKMTMVMKIMRLIELIFKNFFLLLLDDDLTKSLNNLSTKE